MKWIMFQRGRLRFEKLLDQFAIVHAKLAELGELVTRPPPAPPDPFVCALAEADGPNGRTTLGAAARAKENGTVLELVAHVPLKSVRLTVFADLERVSIHGVFVGVDLVTAAMGDCPVVVFQDWPVGVKVRVQCTRRD